MAFSWAIIALSINSFDTWFNPATHSLVDEFGSLPLDDKTHLMEETLLHHLGKTAEIFQRTLSCLKISKSQAPLEHFLKLRILKGDDN